MNDESAKIRQCIECDIELAKVLSDLDRESRNTQGQIETVIHEYCTAKKQLEEEMDRNLLKLFCTLTSQTKLAVEQKDGVVQASSDGLSYEIWATPTKRLINKQMGGKYTQFVFNYYSTHTITTKFRTSAGPATRQDEKEARLIAMKKELSHNEEAFEKIKGDGLFIEYIPNSPNVTLSPEAVKNNQNSKRTTPEGLMELIFL